MKTRYHYDNNFTIEPQIYNDLLLFQIGEMLCDVDTVIDSHVHLNWFEITYVFSGQGTIFSNNKPSNVEHDYIYFSLPNEVHKIMSDNINPLRYFFCAFNLNADSSLSSVLSEYQNIIVKEKTRCFYAPILSVHFKNLLSLSKFEGQHSKLTLEYELKTVILKGLSLLKSEKAEEYKLPKINNIKMLCFNIINYIDENITTMENVTCLSKVFKYNYSYMSRCFKQTIGESISDYFNNKKLGLAKHMIESGELSITQISSMLQYSSIYVFSRAFKNKYNISPSNYRTNKLNKKE